MAGSNLSSGAIRELIIRYETELSKLEFQQENTRKTIDELKSDLKNSLSRETQDRKARLKTGTKAEAAPTAKPKAAPKPASSSNGKETAEKAAPTKRRRTRKTVAKPNTKAPSKRTSTAAAKTEVKKPTPTATKPKEKVKGRDQGYRLSKIDELIFEALDTKGRALITNELQDFAEEQLRSGGETVDSDDVRLKISRSLQKLANRRNDLVKVPFEGRGFAYAIPRWLNKNGDLKAKYKK